MAAHGTGWGTRAGVGSGVALLCLAAVLPEAGLPGLAAVLAITAATCVLAGQRARTGSLVAAGAAAGLADFAMMSTSDHPAGAHRVAVAFWAVLAVLATLSRRRTGQPLRAARSRSGSR